MKKLIRKNWLTVLAFSALIIIFVLGFITYFEEQYHYTPKYYEDVEKCKKTKDKELCKIVNSIDSPQEKFEKEESRDLYFKIMYDTMERYLPLIAPLIIMLIIIGSFHSDFSSGNIKNILTRENLKEYRKKMYSINLKIALIFPIILITTFIICCFITKFNFNLLPEMKTAAQYDTWNYNNFPIYLLTHCLILSTASIFYGNIALLYLNKTKNKFLAIIFSYLTFFAIDIFLYVIIYALILTNVIGLNISGTYFNIISYWCIYTKTQNYLLTLILLIIYTIISFFVVYKVYSNKERILINNEKEVV